VSERETERQERADADRLEELYARARAMNPETRASFLAEACGGDARLREELDSLLTYGEQAEAFFAGLAESVISPAVGHRIGHYQLIGILGSGGMGTVYRAHDTRLDRAVALKFLPSYLSAQPEARERFLVEARAAAALEHPNICSIHEIGETAEERPFIAMACYEGETLKERLSRGPLPPAEAVAIAIQLGRALGTAHARGIVHRDVKPGNIMLCTDGTVRLLDFGLAKVADVSLTGPGVTPGTIAYMSPEQARGDAVDHRTDLWSLGVVFHEMLSGVRPFRGGNDRVVIQAILHDQPEQLDRRLGHASPSPRIIARLLQKLPDDRYQSAGELLNDLEQNVPVRSTGAALTWARARSRAFGLTGTALLAAVALLLLVRHGRPSATVTAAADPDSPSPTIAVLPFTVRGPGLEVWREGMVDLLSMGLDGTAGIRAIDSRTLLARWHKEVGEKAVADLALALGVARRTQAQYALVGSAVAAGPRIRLRADIYDVGSGRVVGPVQVEGPSDSVLALVDRLGMQTLGLVLEKNSGELPVLDLAGVTTTSLVALKAYLEGGEHYRHSEFREASVAWERAVRTDSLFALAYLGLADAYAWSANIANAGEEKFHKALERAWTMADRLPGRERTLVKMRWARNAALPQALTMIQEATRKYPDAADTWYELGETYFHDAASLGSPEQTEGAFRRAAEFQPTMAPYRAHLLDLAFVWHADSAHIVHELENYGELAPEDVRTRAGRIASALAFGDSGRRARARVEIGTLDPETATQVYLFLAHPRFAERREDIFPVVESRVDQHSWGRLQHEHLMNLAMMDGRLHEALAIQEAPTTPAVYRYCGPLYLSARGLPVPESVFDQRFASGPTDSSLLTDPFLVTCVTWYAARHGDWKRHGMLVARARATAARELAAGDTASAGEWDWVARAAEAHGLWYRGRKEQALHAFESTIQGQYGWETLWQVGQLEFELGRLDQAERVFRALWFSRDGVPAYLQRARILERMGRSAEAREAYQFVTYAWRHADPELQPLVEEARQGAARLSDDRD
jgi:tetratricopeptide (TPR) repeat protein/TolB-like protein